MSITEPEPLVSRKEAALFLRKRGYLISSGRLGVLASQPGKGPPFYRTGEVGGRVGYRLSEVEAWWRSKLTRVE